MMSPLLYISTLVKQTEVSVNSRKISSKNHSLSNESSTKKCLSPHLLKHRLFKCRYHVNTRGNEKEKCKCDI